ncbi:TetR/AcrR family transcriptional regulator [Promicromonospora thailandica]|uniref:Transcriptional regulator, TetR family n=1 Tax=Promicromonospora thailandica TaxID=765201 RepID=A0A9X2G762_9MICO|nr:TetR/AcrR family transcriptional regulator C-terminal domain-containing protein [Promicromonospora thailandica]MCP2263771.1 transcriptional regulator, TetR family [Promicromonospora thailandica]
MPRELIDLLWRDHPAAPRGGARGPRSRVSTGAVVETASALADAEGLAAVTVRRLGDALGISTMSVYTHVNGRDDLLVLMADAACARMPRPGHGTAGWRTRVRRVAEANLALLLEHPWLLEIDDDRTAFGPGTIAKYDHELHALDPLDLADVARDAALTFVLDFVRGAARARRRDPRAEEMPQVWARWAGRLAEYLGDAHPLAQRVGGAAGAAMNAPSSPAHAWEFGLDRVLDALEAAAG